MQITSVLLVIIVAIGTIGINILSYCCNHTEISLFTAPGYTQTTTHHHHSHSHTPRAININNEVCCNAHQTTTYDCIVTDDCCADAETESHCHTTDHCTTSNFMQLKPVKNTDYTVVFNTIEPVIMLLFDFIPEVSIATTPLLSIQELPPGSPGREILAQNAILRI